MPAAFSISVSASTKGRPSRSAEAAADRGFADPHHADQHDGAMSQARQDRGSERHRRPHILHCNISHLNRSGPRLEAGLAAGQQCPASTPARFIYITCQSGPNMIVLGYVFQCPDSEVRRRQRHASGADFGMRGTLGNSTIIVRFSDLTFAARSANSSGAGMPMSEKRIASDNAEPAAFTFGHRIDLRGHLRRALSRWRISCSRTRATCRSRYRLTGSSRIAEAGRWLVTARVTARRRRTGIPTSGSSRSISICWRAERGAGKNTLAAYGRDLEDVAAISRRHRPLDRQGEDRRSARLSRRSVPPRAARNDGGAAALGDQAALPVSLCRRPARRRSRRGARRSQARARFAEDADARRSRSAACRRRQQRCQAAPCRRGCARRGSPACSKSSTPPGFAFPSWSRCRCRRPARTHALSSCAAKATRSGSCRLARRPSASMVAYLDLLAQSDLRCAVEMAVPLVRRKRPSDAPAFCPRAQGAGGRRRAAARPSQPARAAPCLCQPPVAQWGRFARGADAARPCRYFDDADLYPCAGGTAQEPGARSASAGAGLIAKGRSLLDLAAIRGRVSRVYGVTARFHSTSSKA